MASARTQSVTLFAIILCAANSSPFVINEIKLWTSGHGDDTPHFIELYRSNTSRAWRDYQVVLLNGPSTDMYSTINLDSEEFAHSEYYVIYLYSDILLCKLCSGAVAVSKAYTPEIDITKDDDLMTFRNDFVDGLVYLYSENDEYADKLTVLLRVNSYIISKREMSLSRCNNQFIEAIPTIDKRNMCPQEENYAYLYHDEDDESDADLDDEEDDNEISNDVVNQQRKPPMKLLVTKSYASNESHPSTIQLRNTSNTISASTRFPTSVVTNYKTASVGKITKTKNTTAVNKNSRKPKTKHTNLITNTSRKPKTKHITPITNTSRKPKTKHTTPVTITSRKPKTKHTTPVTTTSRKPKIKHTTPVTTTSRKPKTKHTTPVTITSRKPQTKHTTPVTTTSRKPKTKHTTPVTTTSRKPKTKHTTPVTTTSQKPKTKHTTLVTTTSRKPKTKHTTPVTTTSRKPKTKHTTPVTITSRKPKTKHTTPVNTTSRKPKTKHTTPVTITSRKPKTKHTTPVTTTSRKPKTKHTTPVTTTSRKLKTKHTTPVTTTSRKPKTKHTTPVTTTSRKPKTKHTTPVTTTSRKPKTKHTTPVTTTSRKPKTKHTTPVIKYTTSTRNLTTTSVTPRFTSVSPTLKHTTITPAASSHSASFSSPIPSGSTSTHSSRTTPIPPSSSSRLASTPVLSSRSSHSTTSKRPASSSSVTTKTRPSVSPRPSPTVSSISSARPSSSPSQPTKGSTSGPTPAPRTTYVVINEANFVLSVHVDTYYVELTGPPNGRLGNVSVVVLDGLTNKLLLHKRLSASHALNSDGLYNLNTKLKYVPEAVAIAVYNRALWKKPLSNNVPVNTIGLMDAVLIGTNNTIIQPGLKEILIPKYQSRVIIVAPRNFLNGRYAISRCHPQQNGEPDPGQFMITLATRNKVNNCSMGFRHPVEFKLKDAKCREFTSRLGQQDKLVDALVQKVADVCRCGVTQLSFTHRKFLCGSLILQTTIESSLMTPWLSDAITRSFKKFVKNTNTLIVGKTNYHTDKCYLRCRTAGPKNHSGGNEDQVKTTVAVVAACIAVFIIILLVVVLYLKRRKLATIQFKLHRLDESDLDNILHEDDDDMENEATFRRITLG